MLVFHELIYEGYILADSPLQVSTGPAFMPLLGVVDVLHVSGYAALVTGTSPTLTISIYGSNDRLFWMPQNVNPVINGLPLSLAGETLFQGVDSSPSATRFAFARLHITLGGTNARGLVRVWATGRDRSRRSAVSTTAIHGERAPKPVSRMSNGTATYGQKA